MRLWSIHPAYLDPAGLTACWREEPAGPQSIAEPNHRLPQPPATGTLPPLHQSVSRHRHIPARHLRQKRTEGATASTGTNWEPTTRHCK
ncbi:MAG: hypothetical protein ACLTZY_09985 [Alistipes indistinctus]